MSEESNIVTFPCRICGEPVTDSREMMEQVSANAEGLAFVCHKRCWEEAERQVHTCERCGRTFGLEFLSPLPDEVRTSAQSCPFCGSEL